MTKAWSIADLTNGAWRTMEFTPFRDGVDICRLLQGEPEVALLRYQPGASVPRHLHQGLETIVVIDGSQSDENGTYPAGSLCINPAGSIHSVSSEDGCVVLIQWEKPVKILE